MKAITRENVEHAYGRYARFYDRVFGAVLEAGRRQLCEAVRAIDPASLLEVGVGTGLTLAQYPARCAVTGIDVSAEMLRYARARAAALPERRIELIQVDGEALGWPDGHFDCVTLPYVLSVTPDPARLAAEARRVCRPGGDIFVLNHFSGDSALWAPLERLTARAAAQIGFRSEFPFEPHAAHPAWRLESVRKVNLMGLTRLAHFRNAPR